MPHFMVEAQGETLPLSYRAVYDTLVQSCGGPQYGIQGVRIATEQFSNWEKQPGYYSLLQDVYTDFSVEQNFRWQAIIQLKNGIDKHWRKTSIHAITKEEKVLIRTRAIESGVKEPTEPLLLQNALMIAKIVRHEFPHDWPDVINTVMGHLRKMMQSDVTSDDAHSYARNVLIITLYIIKELATARLARMKSSLQQAAPELFQVLGSVYVQLVQTWMTFLRGGGDERGGIGNVVLNSYRALKGIRRLIIAGFEHPHRDKDVKQFWMILQQHLGEFWTIWQHAERTKGVLSFIDNMLAKHLFQMSKLHLEMARTHPAAFVLLPASVNLLGSYWSLVIELGKAFANWQDNEMQDWKRWKYTRDGDKVDDMPPLEKLSLKGLLLFRACVKMVYSPARTFKYQLPEDKDERKAAVDILRSEVLTESFVLQTIETLITQFLILRNIDLESWNDDPDEWEKREEEGAEGWEFSLRSCSEKLFLDLVINFKEVVVPRLLEVFQRIPEVLQARVTAGEIEANEAIIVKDALYSAIGIAAPCLEDKFDINELLRSTLLVEVHMHKPYYNILRRRIAILLGQWVPIKPDTINRNAVYEIFEHLLNGLDELNDSVVRVTAGRQLRLVLEPFEFDYNEFAPHTSNIFRGLSAIISEVDASETKMAILDTIRTTITKLEGHIEDHAWDILKILKWEWNASDEGKEHLMQQAILTTITALVVNMKSKSWKFNEDMLPIIKDSVSPNTETSVYLLEEALDLWKAILLVTPSSNPSPSSNLLELALNLLPLLELSSDSLPLALEITESYILLSPRTILGADMLNPLLTSLGPLLVPKNAARQKISLVTSVIETLISTLAMPSYFPTDPLRVEAFQHLAASLIGTGFLPQLLALIKDAADFNNDPRPNAKPPNIIAIPEETQLFTVLARLILVSAGRFLEVINNTTGSDKTITWVMREWLSHIECIVDVQRKKLHVMAITNLLSTTCEMQPPFKPPLFMLDQLESLMTMWTDVVTQLGQDASEESMGDYLWYGYQQAEKLATGTEYIAEEPPEEERKRLMSAEDPIHLVNIRNFIAEGLRNAIEKLGGEAVFQQEWLSNVDSAVVSSFAKLGLF